MPARQDYDCFIRVGRLQDGKARLLQEVYRIVAKEEFVLDHQYS